MSSYTSCAFLPSSGNANTQYVLLAFIEKTAFAFIADSVKSNASANKCQLNKKTSSKSHSQYAQTMRKVVFFSRYPIGLSRMACGRRRTSPLSLRCGTGPFACSAQRLFLCWILWWRAIGSTLVKIFIARVLTQSPWLQQQELLPFSCLRRRSQDYGPRVKSGPPGYYIRPWSHFIRPRRQFFNDKKYYIHEKLVDLVECTISRTIHIA